jgi:phosphatidylinositol glycan class V
MTSLTVAAAARPHLFLVAAFALYKTALLLIAAGTLALDDYDTSSARFSELAPGGSAPGALAGKLLRWDAVYFIHTAQERGYVYEQSWAFGIGFSAVVAGATSALRAVISAAAPGEVVVGVAVAHAAHLAAVLALYRLTVALGGERGGPGGSTLHLVPALLHVVSPAGIFLSAPYAESSFAALSFAGALLFVLGGQRPSGSLARSSLVVLSGVVFGVSATFRSNGALSGLLPLGEAVHLCMRAWASDRLVSWRRVVDVGALGISGLALAAGFAAPQVAAWMRYCSDGRTLAEPAEWCADMPPSIYGYVQRRYW